MTTPEVQAAVERVTADLAKSATFAREANSKPWRTMINDADLTTLLSALATSEARREALEEALTPSADTKAAFIGEFKMQVRVEVDEDGCDVWAAIPIEWTTTKEIMAAIKAYAAALNPQQEGSRDHG